MSYGQVWQFTQSPAIFFIFCPWVTTIFTVA
jgi:hypothetical protein